jgi:hypothetical protein
MYRTVALVVLSLTVVSVSAYGADETTPSAATPTTPLEQTTPSVGNVDWSLPPVEISAGPRPSVLPILYVSFAALQGFDAYSTTAALGRGVQEANPMMRGVAGNTPAVWAVKAASTAASIWFAERLWKTNRVGAIVTMVVVNGMMASVAARNASVLKAVR